jgi:hypothetical protein
VCPTYPFNLSCLAAFGKVSLEGPIFFLDLVGFCYTLQIALKVISTEILLEWLKIFRRAKIDKKLKDDGV